MATVNTAVYQEQRMIGLILFKSLIKDGCKWEGDTTSFKWSEYLNPIDADPEHVTATLKCYKEGIEYKIDPKTGLIWII